MAASASTVSVALCTYNGERFIGEQLESILAQSMLPAEIVLSDDASTDRTVAVASSVVADWQHANPQRSLELRVLRNTESLGVSRNFGRAIAETRGEFVALCDQDDVWHGNRVERAVAVLEANPRLSLVHSDARLVDAGGLPLGDSLFSAYDVNARVIALEHDGRAFEILARRTIVTGAATMIRRRLATAASPFPEGWVHDEWLAIVAAARGELDVLDEQLIDYRQHGGNEIGARTLSLSDKLRRVVEPGAERNRRLLARAGSLAERFDEMPGIDLRFLSAAREMLLHERMRSGLLPSRIARVVPVLRELRTGRYSAFGRGAADAVRDLLQPL